MKFTLPPIRSWHLPLIHRRLTRHEMIVLGVIVIIGLARVFYYDIRPGAAERYLSSAREAATQNDLAKAEKDYKKALKDNDADQVSVWRELGFIYQMQRQPAKAIEAYQKVLELEPDEATVLNNLANSYREIGDYPKAVEAYQKAIKINPLFTMAIINLSHVYHLQAKDDEAIKLLEEHFDRTKRTQDLGFQLVATYQQVSQTEAAKRIVKELVTIDSEHPKTKALVAELGVR